MAETAPGSESRRLLGRQLANYRRAAGYSQQTYADLVSYTRSSVANAETGRQNPPREFWARCDELLDTGGMLAATHDAYTAQEQQHHRTTAQALSPVGDALHQAVATVAQGEADDSEPPGLLANLTGDASPSGAAALRLPAAAEALPLSARADLLLRLVYKLDAEQGGNALFGPAAHLLAGLAPAVEDDPVQGLHAFGQLSQLVGWLALDSNRHGAARRYWNTALYAAHETDDPALAASSLAYMSLQDTYRARPKSALSLARTAYEMSDGSVTPLVRTMLATRLARAYAALGNKAASLRALDNARTAFATTAQAPEPLWASYVDEVELAAQEGACYLELRMPHHARRALARALDTLEAVAPQRVRDAVHYLSRLAKCHLVDHDVEAACAVASDALNRANKLGSARVAARLDEFHTALKPFGNSRPARQFREQYAAVRPD